MQQQWLMSHFGEAVPSLFLETFVLKDHTTGEQDERSSDGMAK